MTRPCWSERSPSAATPPASSTQRQPGRTSPRPSSWPENWATPGGSPRSSRRKPSRRGAAGNPLASRAAAEEGRDLADAIGDQFDACRCRTYLGRAKLYQGDLAAAAAQFAAVADVAEAADDEFLRADSRAMRGSLLAYRGDTAAARAAADAAVETAAELGGLVAGLAYWALAAAALAAGDVETALNATEAAGQHMGASPQTAAVGRLYKAQAALAVGIWSRPAASPTTPCRQRRACSCRRR